MTKERTQRLISNIITLVAAIWCAHYWPWETITASIQLTLFQLVRINEKTKVWP